MPEAASPLPIDKLALLRRRFEQDLPELRDVVRAVAFRRGIRDPGLVDELRGEVVKQVLEQAHKYDPKRRVRA